MSSTLKRCIKCKVVKCCRTMLDGRKFSLFIAQPVPFYFYNKRNFSFTTRLPFHRQEIVLKGGETQLRLGVASSTGLGDGAEMLPSPCPKRFVHPSSYISFTMDVESGEKIKLINFISLKNIHKTNFFFAFRTCRNFPTEISN